jgi:general secretion pathway protein K
MKRRAQAGLAAVTAILIVAVAASAAMLMLAQQSAMLDQTMLVASRAQADQYARAGLDWARGVLMQDSRASNAWDSLDEGWAQPIAALPVERAVVAGIIVDELSKFNLNNLHDGSRKSEQDVVVFKNLLASLDLSPELSDAVLDWIDPDSDLSGAAGAEDAYYLSLKKPYRAANQRMDQVEELYRVRGFDAATVAKLKPYVTALRVPASPGRTSINVNTASEIVLHAALPDMPRDRIAKWVAERRANPLKTKQDAVTWAKGSEAAAQVLLDVKSDYFSVRIQVAQDDVQLATDALIRRGTQSGVPAIVWRRPRY